MRDLDEIYFQARELPPQARAAYLAQVCGDDRALRERVGQMLAISEEAEAFIADLPDLPPGGQRTGDNPIRPPRPNP